MAGLMMQHSPGGNYHIPKGAIVPFTTGAAVPSGWEDFALANGYFLAGAGGTYSVGEIGGSDTLTIADSTSTVGGHTGGSNVTTGGGGPATPQGGSLTGGAHSHTLTGETLGARDVYKEFRLIRAKVAHQFFPQDSFALANVDLSADYDAVESTLDKFLAANSVAGGEGGSSTVTVSLTTNTAGAHGHGTTGMSQLKKFGASGNHYDDAAGGHSHAAFNVVGTLNTKYFYLTAWQKASAQFLLATNMIVMWESLTAPNGWALCDGTQGTPDLRDCFIRLGDTVQMGGTGGDNIIPSLDGTTDSKSHNHAGLADTGFSYISRHSDNVSHSHTVALTGKSLVPPYYALAFIMKL